MSDDLAAIIVVGAIAVYLIALGMHVTSYLRHQKAKRFYRAKLRDLDKRFLENQGRT